MPDKAVSILDTACARLSLGQNATPPALEDTTRQIDALEVQKRILDRETVVGADHQEKLAEIDARAAADACCSIALDPGVDDDVRLEAARLAEGDSRWATAAFRAIAADEGWSVASRSPASLL